MKNICVDSGFMFAVYGEKKRTSRWMSLLADQYIIHTSNRLLVPWPILYESISTRMVKERMQIDLLKRHWKILNDEGRIELMDDSLYREKALADCYEEIERDKLHYRKLSLVDRVVRAMLSDIELNIDLFITLDPGDFCDVCVLSGRSFLSCKTFLEPDMTEQKARSICCSFT